MQPIRTIGYYRKSDDDNGASIDQQQGWAQEVATTGELVILREFADQSVAGWDTAKRTAFHKALAYCQEQARLKNPIEAIICWHTNRLSRADSIETNHYLHAFREAGVNRIRTRERWYDLSRKEDRALLNLEQDFTNREYVINLAADSLRGRLRVATVEGRRLGGPIPYAYRAEKEEVVGKHSRRYWRTKRLVLGPDEEVAVVRWIFETYAAGLMGLRQIAEALNLRGVPAPAGGLWNHQTVRRILRDETYLGRTVWNQQQRGRFYGVVKLKVEPIKPGKKRRTPPEEWVRREGTHDAIIEDVGLFQRCAAMLARHARERNPGTGDFPLSGVLRCGHCGSAMTGRNFPKVSRRTGEKVIYRRYECAGYMTSGKAKCHFGCIDADRLADAVFAKLLPPWMDEYEGDLRAEILRQDRREADAGGRERAGQLRKQIDAVEREIVGHSRELAMTDSQRQMDRLRGLIREAEKRQQAAEEELQTLEGRRALSDPEAEVDAALAMFDRLRSARDGHDRRAQKAVLHEAVTRIEVFFHREQRGRRTHSTFAQALVWVPPDLWAVLSSVVGSISTGS
jgi:DNA invertase Pin-like site-specific DNA recombinase